MLQADANPRSGLTDLRRWVQSIPLDEGGIWHLITRAGSFADLQTRYESLWQSPSSNDKHN
jgi:hypothetical protein